MIMMINSCGDSKTESLKSAFSSYKGRYALLINKKKFTLEVYDSSLKKIITYKIGYGNNPDMKAKLYEGDNRTPEGIYFINEILSMDAGKESESYRKILNMNKVYFSKSKGYRKYGYPDEDLGDNAYGPRYYGINFPGETDISNYKKALEKGEIPIVNGKPAGPGYGIAIHGNNDEDSIGHLCSSGCIRMYNRDIIDLEKYIMLDTPVLIFHE
jgi:lipoprotein-anchoring transpeptidase ErfK/SrfK